MTDIVKADPLTVAYYQNRTHGLWGVGIDAVSALDCWAIKLPGFEGMRLSRGSIPQMGYTPSGYIDTGGSKTLHFPDGNATIARLLVRNLIPAAVPGHTAEDVVTARVDYGRLDRADSQVRLRLNSTVVRVRHAGEPATATGVDVTYMRNGRGQLVRANRCVLACWNMLIPYLCQSCRNLRNRLCTSWSRLLWFTPVLRSATGKPSKNWVLPRSSRQQATTHT